jgi:hypothetical protein
LIHIPPFVNEHAKKEKYVAFSFTLNFNDMEGISSQQSSLVTSTYIFNFLPGFAKNYFWLNIANDLISGFLVHHLKRYPTYQLQNFVEKLEEVSFISTSE